MNAHRGIILAARKGTRMSNFRGPKSTLELKKNLKIMRNILNNFRKNYINEIFIVTGFKSKVFKKYEAKKIINKNWKKTNMFKSLLCADKILNKFPCVVSYSDIVYDHSAIKLSASALPSRIEPLEVTFTVFTPASKRLSEIAPPLIKSS